MYRRLVLKEFRRQNLSNRIDGKKKLKPNWNKPDQVKIYYIQIHCFNYQR